jgi:DNA-binding GntR family transcriptional regulator
MNRLKKGNLASQAYEVVRRRILTFELRPSEYLDEKALASELGIGRTPLREAIIQLKTKGLVMGQPNKSARVKEVTLKGVKDLFEALVVIEKYANCLAAQRITKHRLEEVKRLEADYERAVRKGDPWEIVLRNHGFHRRISESSDNEIIYQIHENLRDQTERLAYLVVSHELTANGNFKELYQDVCVQHDQLVACLENRDVEKMEALTVEHLRSFQVRLTNYLFGNVPGLPV